MAKIITPKQAALAIKKKFDPLGGDAIVVNPSAVDDKGLSPKQLGELIEKGADATGFGHAVEANASAEDAKAATTAGLDEVLDAAVELIETAPAGIMRLHVAGNAGTFLLPVKQDAINDLHIDWGDGSSQDLTATLSDANGVSHTYASRSEKYTINLSGTTYISSPTLFSGGALGVGFASGTTGFGAAANRAKIVGAGGSPFLLLPPGAITNTASTTLYLGAYMFTDCTNSLFNLDPDFNISSGANHLTAAGIGFFVAMFSGCSGASFTLPAGFNIPQGITSIDNLFMASMFYGCGGASFMVPAGFKFPKVADLNKISAFYRVFDSATKPQTVTATSIINGNNTPTSARETFSSAFPDYASLHANWKMP